MGKRPDMEEPRRIARADWVAVATISVVVSFSWSLLRNLGLIGKFGSESWGWMALRALLVAVSAWALVKGWRLARRRRPGSVAGPG